MHTIPIRRSLRSIVILLFAFGASVCFAQQDGGTPFFDSFAPNVLSYEISFSGSTAIGPSDTWLWETGFGFSYLVSNNVRVGFEELGYANTTLLSGTRSGISVAPMAEYQLPIRGTVLELVGGIGIPLQVRFGADIDTKLGVAPFIRLGADIHTSESFSLGLIERISYVLSDAFIMSEHALPSGAIIFATGFAIKYRF